MNDAGFEPLIESLLVSTAQHDRLGELDCSGELRATKAESRTAVHRADHRHLTGLHDRYLSFSKHS